MPGIKSTIRNTNFFAELPDDDVELIASYGQETQLKRGDMLFKQDDAAKSFYIVCSGKVSVEVPALYGPPLIVQELSDGQILGWSWLIKPYKWSFSARAESDTQLIAFDGPKVLQHCEEDPAFGYRILKMFTQLMSERLAAARLQMMESWAAPGAA